ncbi:flagellar hook protein FlgE [Erwinia toletana]|uniref:Flagellar hook protein FlgE n=1 Tax=Winslowiella toletana TaxID=92490 RepID=A0ABS4P5X5_9GAMM|nr:flagellar hook protein FlgE [Winslowiella toletana]MBP2168038.1 flagellar hook protein FlgE [Winslowiella toletana]
MAFSQAVSGLNAASSNLDVIGNNIANSATSGFKSSTVAFADMFAGSNVGMGVKVAGVIQNFNDGTATTTSRGLDVAINKQGFFRLTDTAGAVYYSRNGQFTLDENRNIVNTQGLKVTGYPASGSPMAVQTGASPVALTIPTTQMTAKATSTASLVANLNSSDSVPTNATFSTTDADSYNAKTTVTAYDSLGNTHQIDLYFVKDATDNSWTVHPVDASTGDAAADFTMTFSSATGELLTPTTAQPIAMTSLNGADASSFNLSMTGSMQQNTGADTFGNPTQDGYAPGDLTSYSISDDGTIVGSYSNNRTQVLGQIALANFANPEGLSSAGDNVWQETTSSGQPLIGVAGTGNLGTLTSGALESSNVDLSKELVNMIVAQRNYQSNAQTIKTQDQILNTLVNLR